MLLALHSLSNILGAGLLLKEPYRVAKVHEALDLYPCFALAVVQKGRESSGGWFHVIATMFVSA